MVILSAGLMWLLLGSLWPEGPWLGLQILVEQGLRSLVAWAEAVAAWPMAQIQVDQPPAWLLLLWPALFMPVSDAPALGWRIAAASVMVTVLVW